MDSSKKDKTATGRFFKKSVSSNDIPERKGSVEMPDQLPLDEPITLKALINQPNWADVHFHFPMDTKMYGHSFVFAQRCPGILKPKGKEPKKKKNLYEVEISHPNLSMTLFKIALNYIYTGEIDIKDLALGQAIEFLASLQDFEGLERLKWFLEEFIKKTITMESVHEALRRINEHSLAFLKDFPIYYAVERYDDFVNNKEAIKQLGLDNFQEVVSAFQEFKNGQLNPPSEKPMPPETFHEDMKQIHKSMQGSDIVFKLVDPNYLGISGSVYRTHKAMLGHQSPSLATLVDTPPSKKDENAVLLKGITTEGFEALLKYLYFGEKNLSFLAAAELVTFCKTYQLPVLQYHAIHCLKNFSWEHSLKILQLSRGKGMPSYFKEEMQKLRIKSFKFIMENYEKIDFNEIMDKKYHHSIAPDILLAIQKQERKNANYEESNDKPKEESNGSTEEQKANRSLVSSWSRSSLPTKPRKTTLLQKNESQSAEKAQFFLVNLDVLF